MIRILSGDCRETLLSLKSNSVQCCVTSPPYFQLRSYLPADHPDKWLEIGSEPTLGEWVETMVDVFNEVRRVLRPDGVLFLNLGDAYAGSRSGPDTGSTLEGTRRNQNEAKRAKVESRRRDNHEIPRSDLKIPGLKPKDMMGQPWRVAFALQDAGWWLRQEIIWHKPNPMPESTRDRCTKSHEHVFVLTKSARYYWNFADFQEPASASTHARMAQDVANQKGSKRANGGDQAVTGGNDRAFKAGGRTKLTPKAEATVRLGRGPGWREKNNASFDAAMAVMPITRNPRSVWSIPTHGFKGAHFATFPPALARKCITAGSKPGDMLLDPFGGAGTVGLVGEEMGRHTTLLELDERSVQMTRERLLKASSFTEIHHE